MQPTDKYIGKPYLFNGRSIESFDCLGLLYLWALEHNWNLSFDDGKPIEHNWYEESRFRLARYLLKHMKRIKIPEAKYGDVILWEINNESHTGIYLGHNRVLTTYPDSISQIIRLPLGGRFFVAIFHKEGD